MKILQRNYYANFIIIKAENGGKIFSSNTKYCPCYRYDKAGTEIQLMTLQERCVLMTK